MNAYAMKHFDLLNFVKKSKELGMPEPLAEYQGRQIEEAMERAIEVSHEAVEAREFTSKQDSKETENNLLFKMTGLELQIKEVEARIREVEVKIREFEARLEAKIETKFRDLELKILQSKHQTIIWVVSLLFANGLINHLLK
jgi:hypothetical protein